MPSNHCPNCGSFVSKGNDECSSCGSSLGNEIASTPRCKTCGRFISEGEEKCSSCKQEEELGNGQSAEIAELKSAVLSLQDQLDQLREENECLRRENKEIRSALEEHARCLYEQDQRFRDFVGVRFHDIEGRVSEETITVMKEFWGVDCQKLHRYRTVFSDSGSLFYEYDKWQRLEDDFDIQKVTVPESFKAEPDPGGWEPDINQRRYGTHRPARL
jgi:regulator of replication initiation timing/RNA polymerase subunit RPABC4/transcription elongation factor Spt4